MRLGRLRSSRSVSACHENNFQTSLNLCDVHLGKTNKVIITYVKTMVTDTHTKLRHALRTLKFRRIHGQNTVLQLRIDNVQSYNIFR